MHEELIRRLVQDANGGNGPMYDGIYCWWCRNGPGNGNDEHESDCAYVEAMMLLGLEPLPVAWGIDA